MEKLTHKSTCSTTKLEKSLSSRVGHVLQDMSCLLRGLRWSQVQFIRGLVLKNASLSYFTILKSYFINYTILFYNTSYIQKLYYFTFSLKYYFFNLSLLFLSHHHFFSTKGWNKIYIYIYKIFSIVLKYHSKLRIVL